MLVFIYWWFLWEGSKSQLIDWLMLMMFTFFVTIDITNNENSLTHFNQQGSTLNLTQLATMESMCKNLLSTAKKFLFKIEGSIFFTCHNH